MRAVALCEYATADRSGPRAARDTTMHKTLRRLTIESLLDSPFVTAVVVVSLLSFAMVLLGWS